MKVKAVIDKIYEGGKDLEFLATGFAGLDEKLDGGFLRKEMVVMGAFTGIGKSYVAGQMLYNIAKQGFNTAYFSLEISNETIISRLIGSLSNIKSTRVRTGMLTKEELENKAEAQAKLITHNQSLEFYDDIYELKEITEIIEKTKPEFVVIDFLQNIFYPAKDEYSRLSYVALSLQKLAKKTNCCILALSQLSNSAARAGTSGLLEYKGSGNIATVCDLGFVIERDEPNMFKMALQKNRRGISRIYWDFGFKQPGGWIYQII